VAVAFASAASVRAGFANPRAWASVPGRGGRTPGRRPTLGRMVLVVSAQAAIRSGPDDKSAPIDRSQGPLVSPGGLMDECLGAGARMADEPGHDDSPQPHPMTMAACVLGSYPKSAT
jgi:hypothetical protein